MTADTEFRLSLGHGKRVRPFLLLLVLCTLCSALFSAAAFAASHQQVSVLIVDAGLGDVETFSSNWLGSAVETSAADGARALLSTTHPSWWNGADAPATFLLHNTAAGALTSEDIVWALDAIAASGACPKTVVVALGATGLQARVYAEDLGTTLQSRRADLVGLILLGTPNSGLSMQQTYPQLKLWAPYAAGAGFAPEDLVPGSTLLTSLDAGRFPSILKSLTIRGAAEDLGFGMTDGATVQPDLVLSQAAEVLSDETVVRATLSSGSDLTAYWMPATRKGGEKLNEVNEKAVAKLNAIRSYAAEPAVRAAVKEFYQAWFSEGAPVTHVSTVLTLDISGSMDQKLQSGKTKLAAAKTAAGDFLKSVQARGGQALAVPEDIEVIGFDTETKTIATGADDAAIKAVKAITTGGNTDVGKAIQKSLDALTSSPPAAEKHIVFLSDGLSTEGKSEKKILSGPVTKAKKSGVVIDTVAFGKVGQSDVAFLKKIAKETGGTFFQPTDVYELRESFLKARYTTLGMTLVDADANPSKDSVVDLGTVEPGTRSVEIGLVADGKTPGYTITCDGTALTSGISEDRGSDGMLVIRLDKPAAGTYSIALDGPAKRAHIFAVKQVELFREKSMPTVQKDYSFLFLAAAAGLLVLVVLLTVFASQRARKRKERGQLSEAAETTEATETTETEAGDDSCGSSFG